MSRIFGIDLGTTNSAVAYLGDNEAECVLTSSGKGFLPSKVLFGELQVFVGAAALDEFEESPTTGVYIEGAKRWLAKSRGRLQRDPPWLCDGQWLRPVDVGAVVLCGLKRMVQERLGEPLERAVITHPQHFGDPMRRATERAARLAGIEVVGLLCEPFAAALAYGFTEQPGDSTVMVVDLGGGTLDITVIQASQGHLRELGSAGDPKLGGRDFDALLLKMFIKEYKNRVGEGPTGHELAVWRNLAESTKIRLATEVLKRRAQGATEAEQVSAMARVVLSLEGSDQTVRMEVTESDFRAQAGRRQLGSIEGLCKKALSNAGQTWQSLDAVVFAGGGSLLPMVRDRITRLTSARILSDMDPSKVVALGAAYFAHTLGRGRVVPSLEATDGQQDGLEATEEATGPSLAKPLITAKTTQALGVGLFDPSTQDERVYWLVPPGTEVPCDPESQFPTVRAGQRSISVRFFEGTPEQFKLGTTKVSSLSPIGTCVLELPAPLPAGSLVTVGLHATIGGAWKASVTDPESGLSVQGVFSQSAATSQAVLNQPKGDAPWYPPDDERAAWIQGLELIVT